MSKKSRKNSPDSENLRSSSKYLRALALVGTACLGVTLWIWFTRPQATLPPLQEQNHSKQMTLAQVQQEISKRMSVERQSKEYIWAKSGKTDLLIAEYRKKLDKKGSRPREERVHLLDLLARAARPRKSWPHGLTEAKVRRVIELFAGILKGNTRIASEAIAAVHGLATYGAVLPEYRLRAVKLIHGYYEKDTRPGPRAECILALAALQSNDGFNLATHLLYSRDQEKSRTAIYALGIYLDGPRSRQASTELYHFSLKGTGIQRAIAVKILANKGDRRIASIVPKLLTASSSPPDIEAGAFAAAKLKLTAMTPALRRIQNQTRDPFLLRDVEQALSTLNK